MSTVAKLFIGVGVSDNDLCITTDNVQHYNWFQLLTFTGVADVEVSLDGSTWSTVALALRDEGATASATYVIVTTAARVASFRGKFTLVRVRQNGATACTAHLLAGTV